MIELSRDVQGNLFGLGYITSTVGLPGSHNNAYTLRGKDS